MTAITLWWCAMIFSMQLLCGHGLKIMSQCVILQSRRTMSRASLQTETAPLVDVVQSTNELKPKRKSRKSSTMVTKTLNVVVEKQATSVVSRKQRKQRSAQITQQNISGEKELDEQGVKKKKKGKPKSEMMLHFSTDDSLFISVPATTSDRVAFFVRGAPLALTRHRVTRFGNMFNPSAHYQSSFLEACKPFLPPSPLTGPLAMKIEFSMPRLQSHYNKKRELKSGVDQWHSKKPDVDNLTKFVMDALVDHAYIDDNQVTALIASKRYTDDQPGVKVFLCALAENDSNDDAIEKLMQFSNVVSNAPSR